MKKQLIFLFAAVSLTAFAQDPVVMTVNGKDVTRSEFEYSYNKNRDVEGAVEQKSVEEYAEMYLNYKLKVAAAEDAKMDTISSMKKEFLSYRDIQLAPYLVDNVFIDSVARSLYDRQEKQLNGQDILNLQHIQILVPSNGTQDVKDAALQRADSIYNALMAGADFDELAQKVSENRNTAPYGGRLAPVGPGMLPKDFEEAVYKLQKDEISKPIETADGYHVVKMLNRAPLPPYSQEKDAIVTYLKQQGIEEASAENRIQKIVAQSGGTLTREAVLDSVMHAHVGTDNDLKYLIAEYHDGLLLYELSQREVWTPAREDETALANYYNSHKADYAWKEPRFKGYVIQAKDKRTFNALKKYVKKYAKTNPDGTDLANLVKEEFNKESVVAKVSRKLVVKAGANKYVDQHFFKQGTAPETPDFPFTTTVGKKLKAPSSYLDVKEAVQADYQETLEKEWVERLRARYPYTINKDVLSTVNNH
ncbi:MAG: peptidylprolyl isomerase [Bacteroidaceae bacterium]|nr:peptidylprolyl isomerase [Bacteroidaceae bacterium]